MEECGGRPRGLPFWFPELLILSVKTQRLLIRAGWTGSARGRSRLLRTVIGVTLAIHGFVIAAAPVADALSEHADSIVAHWEDAQDTRCPPQHDASACQLCRVISATSGETVPERGAAARVVSVTDMILRDASLGSRANALGGSPRPRGPPTV